MSTTDWIPPHGGDLLQMEKYTGLAPEQWLDLSTGINSRAYPFTPPDYRAYTAMPYASEALRTAAEAYYGGGKPLVVAGTEAVINILPQTLISQPLLVPEIGYQAYARQWSLEGREVITYPSLDHDEAVAAIDDLLHANPEVHLLIINPNNPTGVQFSVEQIRRWSYRLTAGSCLIVDEAFMDLHASGSMLRHPLPENVMVLRSFGKFFGLPGLRIGFVFSNPDWLQSFASRLGVWAVNGPAQMIATEALLDHDWQEEAKDNISRDAEITTEILSPLMQQLSLPPNAQMGLFTSYRLPLGVGKWLYNHFSRMGVLLRPVFVNDKEVLIRIGIVNGDNASQLVKLQKCVARVLDYLETINGQEQGQNKLL